MRMVIAGGGTGGHVFPGIAVAEEIKKRDRSADIYFIGTEHGLESKVVPKEGYPIRFVPGAGFVGKTFIKKVTALAKLMGSLARSRSILRALKPDVVIGTGGYASVGPVAMACLMRIPVVIMEQNLVPGLANKILARFADAVAVTYHESISFLPKSRTYLTGNPIRAGILSGDRSAALNVFSLSEERFTIFVLGGSAGSRHVNQAVIEALDALAGIKDKVQFLHQTGEKDFESVRKAYRDRGFFGMAAPFIYRMAEAYAVSDLVISRAGATTLAEVTALGRPAILIPYPHAAGHQEFNAGKLAKAGACLLIRDSELTGQNLADAVVKIYSSSEMQAEMRAQSSAMGRPEAAQKIADIALSLVKFSGKGRQSNV